MKTSTEQCCEKEVLWNKDALKTSQNPSNVPLLRLFTAKFASVSCLSFQ